MDDKTLVERLRENVFYGDARSFNFEQHNPLAMKAADTIEAQATRIEALEAALRRIKDATDNETRAGDKGYVSRYGIHGIATKALESKP